MMDVEKIAPVVDGAKLKIHVTANKTINAFTAEDADENLI
jgi:hypothetical protein